MADQANVGPFSGEPGPLPRVRRLEELESSSRRAPPLKETKEDPVSLPQIFTLLIETTGSQIRDINGYKRNEFGRSSLSG